MNISVTYEFLFFFQYRLLLVHLTINLFFPHFFRSSTNAGGRHVSEAKHAYSDGTQDKIAWERTLDGNRGKKTVKERRRGKTKKEEEGKKEGRATCVLCCCFFFSR